jgi:hypothetical protein
MFDKVTELVKIDDLKKEWEKRKQNMLAEKINVTDWICDFLNKHFVFA